MHIRHVIAGVGPSAPQLLQDAHRGALTAAARAASAAPGELRVEIIVVGLPDEPAPVGPWTFRPTRRPPLGEHGFSTRRRLPFLSDVIAPLDDPDAFDVGIVTNADIEVAEEFYEHVRKLWSDDPTPTSITRMTEDDEGHGPPRRGEPRTAREHPGHDCFVAGSSHWQRARPGDVVLGVPGVMKALLWSLSDHRPVTVLHGTGWTAHRGDDRPWASRSVADYAEHNRAALTALAAELVAERGEGFTATVPSMRPYLGRQPDGRTMVFSLNPGRSGSESLARVLATSSQVVAGHEREPIMMGPWLRMVGFEGLAATRLRRRVKARAIEVELELFRPGVYADTSHLFLYTFADVVLDHFVDREIVVVRLHRDPMDVARSLVELGYFSRTSTLGLDWHFWPTWPMSLMPMPIDRVTGEWDLVFGSLVDFYRRQAAFLDRWGGQVRLVPLRASDLADPAWQDGLAGALGIDPASIGGDDQSSTHWNRKATERVRSVTAERVHDEFAAFCDRFGVDRAELDRFGWNGPFT